MKYLIALILGTALAGCAIKGINSTLFLREEDAKLVDLKGNACLESGYQVMKHPKLEDKYILITAYENCDVHKERVLQDFEPKQWGQSTPKMEVGF